MPVVRTSAVLKAVYQEAAKRIAAREIPTELILPDVRLYRAYDLRYAKIANGRLPKAEANLALIIRDQYTDRNRYSGQSLDSGIPAAGGLYCSFQQQAIVNEALYYARSDRSIPRSTATGAPDAGRTMAGKCIVQIRLMCSLLAADLSPHNRYARDFVESVGRAPDVQHALRLAGRARGTAWGEMHDSVDCSFARGIGLAVANSGYLLALKVSTARESERSPDETGDNLVLFGQDGEQVPNLWIDHALVVPLKGPAQRIAVNFA
jgi:hypothetical protein